MNPYDDEDLNVIREGVRALCAERTLIAAECIGDGRWFIEKASAYARDRVVFGRPIGQNQGVQFPIAEAHIEIEAADLMRWRACEEYDSGKNAGASANMAKYLAAKASWEEHRRLSRKSQHGTGPRSRYRVSGALAGPRDRHHH